MRENKSKYKSLMFVSAVLGGVLFFISATRFLVRGDVIGTVISGSIGAFVILFAIKRFSDE